MKKTSILFIAAAGFLASGCKQKSSTSDGAIVNITISPRQGYGSYDGKPVDTKISYPDSYSPDSVVYFLDSVKIGSKTDSSAISIKTDTLHMGARNITAKVYKDGKIQKVSTNFFAMPAQMPEQLTYNIIKQFPHDTSANTEGLSYDDGFLYETIGDSTKSELRKVDLETGKVVMSQRIGSKYYAKGNTIVGDKILVFVANDTVGMVFDKKTLKPVDKFNRGRAKASWGAAFDGSKIYVDDSYNRIWLLDKNNYRNRGYIDVFDHESPVEAMNELEYIDGKLYANVYGYDTIIIIDPRTGAIEQSVNMTNIWPYKDRPKKNFDNEINVLNGIAWDAKGKRLFVTGKKWAYVYQIEVVKALPASIRAR